MKKARNGVKPLNKLQTHERSGKSLSEYRVRGDGSVIVYH